MRVSELAKNLEVNPDTVRYYTRIGLLRPRKNAENGYKEYDERDISRLNFYSQCHGVSGSQSKM